MNSKNLPLPMLSLALALSLVQMSFAADDAVGSLLARLYGGDRSPALFYSLEEQPPDPRTLPGLRAAFQRTKRQQDKELIAATLIRLGEKSDEYFNYLSALARDAIADAAPFFLKYDHGSAVRGAFDEGFLNWCALNHKVPKDTAAAEFGSYPAIIRMLAYSEDKRASDTFEDGLQSSNPLIVTYSVEGLGRLHEIDALPLVEKALERAQPGDRSTIAAPLVWFGVPQAESLLARFVPDVKTRDFVRRPIDLMKNIENERLLRRRAQSSK